MKTLKLIKAFRTTESIVKILYYHNPTHQEFVIEWCNIEPEGGIGEYDLQVECLSNSESFNNLIEKSINDGESDNEPDSFDDSLYIELRDTFDSSDCEQI